MTDHIGLTPSQTVGPFYAIGLPFDAGPFAVSEGTPGAIWVRGTVYDGAGAPVPDALLESWQTDPPAGDDFRAFTRCATDPEGRYAILTRRPGPVPGPDGSPQAPHLDLTVFARGLLDRVVTRIYFADEPANDADPVLGLVSDPADRATLIATPGPDGYVFDVHLQGDGETVFFSI
jgi:protocatechuate 3,4-dioxygenase, alpha subunit